MSRPRKYKRNELKKAVSEYFGSITVLRPLLSEKGEPVLNTLGEPFMQIEYLTPPTVTGLCLKLGIERSTWQNYGNKKMNPELYDIVAEARMRFESYLEEELIKRTRGSVNGLIFNLKNNYGWKDSREVEIGKDTLDRIDEPLSLSEKLEAIRTAAKTAFGDEDDDKEE